MRGKWFILSASVALVTLVAVAATMLLQASRRKIATGAPPSPVRPSSPEINLAGKVRAQQVINVAAPLEGVVGAFFAEVGQEVFQGQLLARITNQGLETGQQAAQKEAEVAQSKVNALESEIVSARLEASRARADASRARSEYERVDKIHRRQQMLFNEGATPKLAFEKSSRDFDLAQTELRTVEQVAANAESRVAELVKTLDAGKRVLREKTEGLEGAAAKSAATELVSPVQGIVVARRGEVGQPIALDQVDFFQIATQLSQLEVVLEPDPPHGRRRGAGELTGPRRGRHARECEINSRQSGDRRLHQPQSGSETGDDSAGAYPNELVLLC